MNSTIEDLGFRKFSKMVLKLEINCQISGSRSSLYAYLVRRVGEQYERENTLRPMILVKLPSRRFIFIQKKMLKRSIIFPRNRSKLLSLKLLYRWRALNLFPRQPFTPFIR